MNEREYALSTLINKLQYKISKLKKELKEESIANYREGYLNGFLDAPESKLKQKQKPLTGKDILQAFQSDEDAINADSYWAGVLYAEKAHGIGVDNE